MDRTLETLHSTRIVSSRPRQTLKIICSDKDSGLPDFCWGLIYCKVGGKGFHGTGNAQRPKSSLDNDLCPATCDNRLVKVNDNQWKMPTWVNHWQDRINQPKASDPEGQVSSH